MGVGDWADDSDFWTDPPALIYSAVMCNTMFLNAWRLVRGGERIPADGREDDLLSTVAVPLVQWIAFSLNDPGPYDRIRVMDKIKTNGGGSGNITSNQQHFYPAVALPGLVLNCSDYQAAFTWVIVYDGDITGWAAGDKIFQWSWTLSGTDGCTELLSRCRHAMLYSSLTAI